MRGCGNQVIGARNGDGTLADGLMEDEPEGCPMWFKVFNLESEEEEIHPDTTIDRRSRE